MVSAAPTGTFVEAPGTAARHSRYLVVGTAIAACAVFVASAPSGFVFDDIHQILNNPWIRDFRHLADIFSTHVWAFAGRESNYYRPLMHVAYAVMFVVFGPRAWAFRALSILVHAATTVLVFLVARRLQATGMSERDRVLEAFIASILFAVHPIHVEAVAWVSSLPDVGCGALFLAALVAFLDAARRPERSLALHAAGAIAFLAALLLKEPGLMLIPLVALFDCLQRVTRSRTFWATRYGLLSVAVGIYLVLRIHAIGGIVPYAATSTFTAMQAIDVAGIAFWRYVTLLAWPFSLNVFRTMDDRTGLPGPAAWVVLIVAVCLAWRYRRSTWRVTVAGGLMFLPLVPALYAPALLPGLDNPWAERYAYLSSAGFALAVAMGFSALARRASGARLTLMCVLVAAVIAFSAATIRRCAVWKTDVTLWTDAVEKSPRSAAAHSYLGWALFSEGHVDAAMREYQEAIRLNPALSDARHNLAVALAAKGLHADAVLEYSEAVRLKPREPLRRANLALSLARLGRHDAALQQAEQAVELGPGLSACHAALGVSLGESGRIAEAAAEFRRAIELNPNDQGSRQNLAIAERLLGSRRLP